MLRPRGTTAGQQPTRSTRSTIELHVGSLVTLATAQPTQPDFEDFERITGANSHGHRSTARGKSMCRFELLGAIILICQDIRDALRSRFAQRRYISHLDSQVIELLADLEKADIR